MKHFDLINHYVDQKLIQIKLKKKPMTKFEIKLTDFIQIFLMNLNGGLILEEALGKTIESSECGHELKRLFRLHQSAITGLNYYANSLNSEPLWRLTRLINQAQQTGHHSLEPSVEKIYESLWTEKTNRFKKKSETVSIQLTFLLMLSLISVIIVVISPILILL